MLSPCAGCLIDTDVGQLTVGAVLQLEGVGHQRVLVAVAQHEGFFAAVAVDAVGFVLDLGGVGQVAHHGVEQKLDACSCRRCP